MEWVPSEGDGASIRRLEEQSQRAAGCDPKRSGVDAKQVDWPPNAVKAKLVSVTPVAAR